MIKQNPEEYKKIKQSFEKSAYKLYGSITNRSILDAIKVFRKEVGGIFGWKTKSEDELALIMNSLYLTENKEKSKEIINLLEKNQILYHRPIFSKGVLLPTGFYDCRFFNLKKDYKDNSKYYLEDFYCLLTHKEIVNYFE
jgi:hypothetical protein